MSLLAAVWMFGVGLSHAGPIAVVNQRPILESEFSEALSTLNESQKTNFLKDPNNRRDVLDQIIDQELVYQEAIKAKLEQSAQFKKAMEGYRRQLLVNLILEKALGSRMSDSAARAYYNKNRSVYSTDQVNVRHVLTETEADAKKILQLAKQKDADFAALAEKHSKDPSAKNNRGEVGYFTRDRMVKPFSDVAFRAGVGEIVGPVKTLYGYHVIQVVDKKFGKPLEYDEVELRVKTDLKQELVQEYARSLRDRAKIQVDPRALEKIK